MGGVDALLIAIATVSPENAYFAALCAIAGSVAGSYVLFAIARKGGEVMLEKHTSHGTGLKIRRWFERFGLLAVFVPALSPIPLPMKIAVFCAGALEVRARSLLAVVTLARVIRYFALAYLGQRYGQYTLAFLKAHWFVVLLFVIVLSVAAVAVLRLVNRGGPNVPAGVSAADSK